MIVSAVRAFGRVEHDPVGSSWDDLHTIISRHHYRNEARNRPVLVMHSPRFDLMGFEHFFYYVGLHLQDGTEVPKVRHHRQAHAAWPTLRYRLRQAVDFRIFEVDLLTVGLHFQLGSIPCLLHAFHVDHLVIGVLQRLFPRLLAHVGLL